MWHVSYIIYMQYVTYIMYILYIYVVIVAYIFCSIHHVYHIYIYIFYGAYISHIYICIFIHFISHTCAKPWNPCMPNEMSFKKKLRRRPLLEGAFSKHVRNAGFKDVSRWKTRDAIEGFLPCLWDRCLSGGTKTWQESFPCKIG